MPKKSFNGKQKALHKEIDIYLARFKNAGKNMRNAVSPGRFKQLTLTVHKFYDDVWDLGHRISMEQINQKHIEEWFAWLHREKYKTRTIREYAGRIQTWVGWIGKPGLLHDPNKFIQGMKSRGARYLHKMDWRCRKSLEKVLRENNHKHLCKNKEDSFQTQRLRQGFLFRFYGDLYRLGFKLTDVKNLKEKHILAWFESVETKLDPGTGTLNNYSCYLAALCKWIGKPDMFVDPRHYLGRPDYLIRTYVSNQDKTCSNPDVLITVDEMLERLRVLDPHVEALVQFIHKFGVRVEEALLFRPYYDDKGTYICVFKGTKGGRRREVPIETDDQRLALENLKAYAKSKEENTIPDSYSNRSYKEWENHVRYVARKAGLTRRQCGYTLHSLRHEYANRIYTEATGVKSRVKGGTLSDVDRSVDQKARQQVSQNLGHGRPQITNCYLGSNVPISPKDPEDTEEAPENPEIGEIPA